MSGVRESAQASSASAPLAPDRPQLPRAEAQPLGKDEQRPGGERDCLFRARVAAFGCSEVGGQFLPDALPVAGGSEERAQAIEDFLGQRPAAESVSQP
jgi:hypothetical protein